MAVYTEVPQDEAAALLRELQLGELTALRGTCRYCASHNSNAALALPSTGGAASLTLSASPCSPEISLLRAPG